jgi:hypothetical protein
VEPRDDRDRGDRADEQDDERRGQDPPCATRPERRERHAAGGVDLAQEMGRDQVARDREEDIDADEPAAQRVRPQVVDQDEQYRYGPQRLDLGSHVPAERGRRHASTWP